MKQESRIALRTRCLALVAIVVVTFGGCGQERAELLTVFVERGGIEATVSATGTLNPVHMVEVGTRTSGRIEIIDVDYNSRVTRASAWRRSIPPTR